MYNLSFKRNQESKVFRPSFPPIELVRQPDGSVKAVVVSDPYEGLSANSFDLDAQLAAGVPLSDCGFMSSGSIHSVDINNERSRSFMSHLSE